MPTITYIERRGELETYFDRTAVDAWRKLTSDAPLGRIRKTVRAGREAMRSVLLGWLPDDMSGMRLLDAGCGTGALALAAAQRGASVVAVDISPTLIGLARERTAKEPGAGAVEFCVGDMLSPGLGRFDYVVAMDSLIHYCAKDMVVALARLAKRADRGVVFTYAPKTPLLTLMHAVGRTFPRSDRAPAIEPISGAKLAALIESDAALGDWRPARTLRIANGFYTSQAMELIAA
jgi:magnesium-protoporphyrin O-methyltransferase